MYCLLDLGYQTEALSIYLNNQADVLHAYLVHFGKVEEVAQDPRILDFDDHVSLRSC